MVAFNVLIAIDSGALQIGNTPSVGTPHERMSRAAWGDLNLDRVNSRQWNRVLECHTIGMSKERAPQESIIRTDRSRVCVRSAINMNADFNVDRFQEVNGIHLVPTLKIAGQV